MINMATSGESAALKKAREKRMRAIESLKDAISNLEVVTDGGTATVGGPEGFGNKATTYSKIMAGSTLLSPATKGSMEADTLRRAKMVLQSSTSQKSDNMNGGYSKETEVPGWRQQQDGYTDMLGDSGETSIHEEHEAGPEEGNNDLQGLEFLTSHQTLDMDLSNSRSPGSGKELLNGGSAHDESLPPVPPMNGVYQESHFEMQAERDRALKLCLQYRQKMVAMKTKIKTKDQKIRELEDQATKAEESIQKSKDLFAEMMTKVKEGVDNQVQLETEANKSRDEVIQLAAGLRKMRTVVERLEQELSERRQENRALQDTIEQYERGESQAKSTDAETEEVRSKLTHCERQLVEAQLELQKSTEALHGCRADLEEARSAHSQAAAQVDQLQKALAGAEQRLKDRERWQQQVEEGSQSDLQEQMAQLQELVGKLEVELLEKQSASAEREAGWAEEAEALKGQYQQAQAQLEELQETSTKEKDEMEARYQESMASLREEKDTAEFQMEELKALLEAARMENAIAVSSSEEEEASVCDDKEDDPAWLEKYEALSAEKIQVGEDIEELSANLEKMRLEKERHSDTSSSSADSREELVSAELGTVPETEALEEGIQKLEQLQARAEDLRTELEAMEGQRKKEGPEKNGEKGHRSKIKLLKKQINILQDKLSQSQEACQEAVARAEELQRQLAEKDASVEDESERLKAVELETVMVEKDEQLQEAVAEVERLQLELELKTQSIQDLHTEMKRQVSERASSKDDANMTEKREAFLNKICASSNEEYFTFLKHGKRGGPKQRVLRTNPEKTHIFYHDPGSAGVKPKALIPLEGLQLVIGRNSQLFKTQAPAHTCISIINGQDSHTGRQLLNVQCNSESQRQELIEALSRGSTVRRNSLGT